MSEPQEPNGEGGTARPEQPAAPRDRTASRILARLRGRAGWGPVAIGFTGALVLLIVVVATGPLWVPLLPWAARNEPAADARVARVETPPPPREPQSQPADFALQGLERRVAALEARPTVPPNDLAGIRQEAARLAGSTAELAARIDAIEKAVRSPTVGDPTDIALVLALLQIRDAIEVGRPFTAAYEALVALAQARPEIAAAAAPLAEGAKAGLPGRPVLANRLRELADAISSGENPTKAPATDNDAEGDWADQVWRRLSGLVMIRRIDSADEGKADGRPAAAVKAALQALAGGDLEGAVAALDKLAGASAEVARPWLHMAKERLAAEMALQKIEALLVTRLGAPANAQPGSGPPR